MGHTWVVLLLYPAGQICVTNVHNKAEKKNQVNEKGVFGNYL